MIDVEGARSAVLIAPVERLLSELGDETRVVGGAVRNGLLGAPIQDFDLATALAPKAVMEKARAAGWKVVPTGIEHGTVTVVIEGKPYEVTTLREDIATNGRHAEVRFGTSFTQDAARRDFTINAMSMGIDGVLHDDFGGLEDLAAGRVRFIGDAATRLAEDYLRGLRFLRFSATYGHAALDSQGLAAVNAGREGFSRLSRERVRQEFLKLIMAPRVVEVMAQAQETGLIADILGLPVDIGWMQARINAGDANPMARLFALAVRRAADVAALRESLRLTNAEMRQMESLEAACARFCGQPPGAMRAMAADFPLVAHEVAVQLGLKAGKAFVAEALSAMAPLPRFVLSGKDALASGVEAGPAVGAVLDQARALWVARGCDNSREAQFACLNAVVGRG